MKERINRVLENHFSVTESSKKASGVRVPREIGQALIIGDIARIHLVSVVNIRRVQIGVCQVTDKVPTSPEEVHYLQVGRNYRIHNTSQPSSKGVTLRVSLPKSKGQFSAGFIIGARNVSRIIKEEDVKAKRKARRVLPIYQSP